MHMHLEVVVLPSKYARVHCNKLHEIAFPNVTRLGCFYVTAISSWGCGWGWVEFEIEAEAEVRLSWGWAGNWDWIEI